ncbi:hypothetical protein BHQ29_00505 [Pseudomonas sp. LPH1]|nr:hypothetical protein BHQ29_00505 [Pseudomonas sp. LPH1]
MCFPINYMQDMPKPISWHQILMEFILGSWASAVHYTVGLYIISIEKIFYNQNIALYVAWEFSFKIRAPLINNFNLMKTNSALRLRLQIIKLPLQLIIIGPKIIPLIKRYIFPS